MVVVSDFRVVANSVLEKTYFFGPDHCQVGFVLVEKVNGSVGSKVLENRDVLDLLEVLAAPDLENGLGIEGNDDGILARTLDVGNGSFVPL